MCSSLQERVTTAPRRIGCRAWIRGIYSSSVRASARHFTIYFQEQAPPPPLGRSLARLSGSRSLHVPPNANMWIPDGSCVGGIGARVSILPRSPTFVKHLRTHSHLPMTVQKENRQGDKHGQSDFVDSRLSAFSTMVPRYVKTPNIGTRVNLDSRFKPLGP